MFHGKYREKIPWYSVVPWLYFNFNDTILCLIIAIFNTSSGIKYVLSPIIDVTTTFGSIHSQWSNYSIIYEGGRKIWRAIASLEKFFLGPLEAPSEVTFQEAKSL